MRLLKSLLRFHRTRWWRSTDFWLEGGVTGLQDEWLHTTSDDFRCRQKVMTWERFGLRPGKPLVRRISLWLYDSILAVATSRGPQRRTISHFFIHFFILFFAFQCISLDYNAETKFSFVHLRVVHPSREEWLLQFQKQSCILSLELRFTAFGAELKLAGERTGSFPCFYLMCLWSVWVCLKGRGSRY